MSDRFDRAVAPAERSLALPLVIGLVALAMSLGFQTYGLVRERSAIAVTTADQGPGLQDGDRTRTQLETLLSGANDLAKAGNPTATAAMAELAKQGIGYNPPR